MKIKNTKLSLDISIKNCIILKILNLEIKIPKRISEEFRSLVYKVFGIIN